MPHTPDSADELDGLDVAGLRARTGIKWSSVEPDVIPAWIADMDFPAPPVVRRTLHELVDAGDLGYPEWVLRGTPLRAAFAERMADRYGWAPEPERVRELADIIQGLQLVLQLWTDPGDAVAIHTPTYPPFLGSIATMGRRLVPIPMVESAGRVTFDADRFERDAAESRCRVLVLVNPHNPTGRVLTVEELTSLAEVAERHDLLVVSDEVHADLAYAPHRHVPFASLGADVARRTVTLTSATKAFNLAGVRTAVAHVGSDELLARRDAAPPDLYGQPNLFGVAATLAAWRDGSAWLEEVLTYLDRNRRLVADTLAERLPDVRHRAPEATYLAWLDLSPLGLGADPSAALLRRGRIALSPGPDFGPGGDGHARLNFATSRSVLQEILDRLVASVG